MAIDPAWLEEENIDRVGALSLADFQARYEGPNRPVLVTDVVGASTLFQCPPLVHSFREGGKERGCALGERWEQEGGCVGG